ncbi:GntR family transcriptional regulator [Risungbinella massiliensis]|uniref:GntR family transcriptional regulator n=1 Tax=Risungbinella massiliensis TaxID=1329796 RepID=UPI0005CC4D89|nr:GntR family transcriptional regulator [Risungbinella massiliensis]
MMKSFSSAQPIYLQIIDEFKRKICKGELQPGDKLPAVREAAAELEVNPNTVQRAYAELERAMIVEKKRGQGSFVTMEKKVIEELRAHMALEQVNRFYESMVQLGFSGHEIVTRVQEKQVEMEGERNE